LVAKKVEGGVGGGGWGACNIIFEKIIIPAMAFWATKKFQLPFTSWGALDVN